MIRRKVLALLGHRAGAAAWCSMGVIRVAGTHHLV